MSLTSRCAPDELAQVKDAFEEFDTGGGFDAEDVDLMGRVGRAEGGEWRRIERFPLTTGSPA